MHLRTCNKCNVEQFIHQFYKNKLMKDGYLNQCKSCVGKRVTDYRVKNLEKLRAYDRLRGDLPNRIRARKEYSQKIQSNSIKLEKYIEVKKSWVSRNQNKRKAHILVKSAIRAGSIIKQSNCQRCGLHYPKLHAHHLESHDVGVSIFQKKYGIDLWKLAAEFAAKTTDTSMKEAIRGEV